MKPADTHRTAFTSVTQIRIKLDYKRRARRRLWTRAVVAMKTSVVCDEEWQVMNDGRFLIKNIQGFCTSCFLLP